MKFSVVTTLYYSSPYVEEFYTRITAEIKKIVPKIGKSYEIIFVDDGSPDDSLQKAITLHKKDKNVKVIELSRNFGHHKAIMTGLSYAKGDYVFLIDSDLEEEPELLGQFWQEMQKQDDVDVVYGVQEKRKGGWFERWSGELFYNMFNWLSDIKHPENMITARLMQKIYVDELLKYSESELSFGIVMIDCGFKQVPVVVRKLSTSKTTYTLLKKISLAVTSIVSYSARPLVYIFNIGFFITLFSALFILKLIFGKLFWGIGFAGYTSLIVSIWFFGGLIILFLGVIGIYLSKVFVEVKQRPRTVVRREYGKSS